MELPYEPSSEAGKVIAGLSPTELCEYGMHLNCKIITLKCIIADLELQKRDAAPTDPYSYCCKNTNKDRADTEFQKLSQELDKLYLKLTYYEGLLKMAQSS